MPERPEVPDAWLARLRAIFDRLPECSEEDAWVGVRWRVRSSTVAHVFGGEDQILRITFRAEADEVMAFQHLGPPYFRAGWGTNVVGLLLPDRPDDPEAPDTGELTELLTESYCIQAPAHLAAKVPRPGAHERL